MEKENRIEMDGDYLIIAPKGPPEYGYHHSLTERAFLVDNLVNFINRHHDINIHQITVYELREVNLHALENDPKLPT
jgi:hypothetical protein